MAHWFKRHPRLLCILLALIFAVALRLVIWQALGSTPQMMPDSQSYLTPAHSLLEEGVFALDNGQPATVRTPGYPLFIAAMEYLGGGLDGIVLVQHFFCLGIAILMAYILAGFDLGESSQLAIGLFGINFLFALYSNFILSEILFASMVTGAYALLIGAAKTKETPIGYIAGAAVLAGTATLVRPIGLFMFIPATVYILLCIPRQRLVLTVIFLVIFAVAPGYWMARNHAVNGQYTLSTISDINILGYQGAGTLAVKEGGDYASTHERIKQELYAQAKGIAHKSGKPLNQVYRELGIQIIKDNPLPFAKHAIRNVITSLLGYATSHLARLTGMSDSLVRILVLAHTIPALLMSLWGLLICWHRFRPLAILAFLFIGYFVGIAAMGGVGGSRFRIPVEPLSYMLIGVAGVDLFRRLRPAKSL